MPARNFLVFVVDLLVGPRDAGFRASRGCPTDIDDTERDAAAERFGVAVERADGRVLVSAILQTADRGAVTASPFGDIGKTQASRFAESLKHTISDSGHNFGQLGAQFRDA